MTNTQEADDFGPAAKAPDAAAIARIKPAAIKLYNAAAKVKRIEEELAAAQADVVRIEEQELPAILDELGVTHFGVVIDGEPYELENTISVKASIPKENPERRQRGLAWLRDNGHEAIIKRAFSVKFGNSEMEQEAAEAFAKYLDAYDGNIEIVDDDEVHHSKLTAYVKELIEAGDLTVEGREALGVFERKYVAIGKPKEQKRKVGRKKK